MRHSHRLLAGIFHFRFWRYQQWYDVVIDDRLPYLNKRQRLWSARNLFEINEFWVSLMEKAYAKLNGTYGNLAGGLPVNARFELKSNMSMSNVAVDDLFDFIRSCIEFGSLIACSINSDQRHAESILANGLVVGHTYSITNYHILSTDDKQRVSDRGLLRFRNPWGNDIEWNGLWSDADPIWNSLDERTRQRLSIQRKHDGEFWMSFKDFYREFDVMEVCHISPDTYDGRRNLSLFDNGQLSCRHSLRIRFD
jgi:calpain, invertebrate